MGFAAKNEIVKKFHYIEAEEVSRSILDMCECGMHSLDLDIVLKEWKFALLHNLSKEQDIFRAYLAQIFSHDTIEAMEGVLHYER